MSRTVVVKGFSGLCQTLTIGPHELLADEAKDVGSNDRGPDPYEYLLAALGTCTNMTLRMYADRKRWQLREVRTALSHTKSYAADCEHCEQPDAMVDRIDKEITLRRVVGRATQPAAANRSSLPGASNADFEDCDPHWTGGRHLTVNRGLWKGSTWLAVRSLSFEAKWR